MSVYANVKIVFYAKLWLRPQTVLDVQAIPLKFSQLISKISVFLFLF